jgi:hypothetical protein
MLHHNRVQTIKYLKEIKMLTNRIKRYCNSGAVITNKRRTYGRLKIWYLLYCISNIFLIHELTKLYCITYNNWKGYYVVHTPRGEVRFYKDEQGLTLYQSGGVKPQGGNHVAPTRRAGI